MALVNASIVRQKHAMDITGINLSLTFLGKYGCNVILPIITKILRCGECGSMLRNAQISKKFLPIAAMLVLCAIILPGKVQAAAVAPPTSVQDDCQAGNNPVDTTVQNNLAATGQSMVQAKQGIIGSYGISSILNSCKFTSISGLFSTLSTMSVMSSPFAAIANIIIQQIIGQVTKMISQVCQALVNDVKTLVQNALNSALGGICIPLPNLGLGIKVLKVQPTMAPPCGSNSISVLQLMSTLATRQIPSYSADPTAMFQQGQGMGIGGR
jgi:hypothetical protein